MGTAVEKGSAFSESNGQRDGAAFSESIRKRESWRRIDTHTISAFVIRLILDRNPADLEILPFVDMETRLEQRARTSLTFVDEVREALHTMR